MNRQCKDCQREEEVPLIMSSGGFSIPTADSLFERMKPDWYCAECRAKYPTPETYTTPCEECNGCGQLAVTHHCKGCDHECRSHVQCDMCHGEGSYSTHDCNPGCDHSGLPLLSATRGGIQFANLEGTD